MNKKPESQSKRVKVVFLGDRAVGKSSIINRFITGQYQQNLQPTVGVDYLGKNLKYKNNDYRIELWDTAGQQKFRSLVKGYLRGTDVCVFVYDCTCLSSYLSLPDWLALFDSVETSACIKLIAGNKCDKKYQKTELETAKEALQNQNEQLRKIPELITSAKMGINIEQLFQQILELSSKLGDRNKRNSSITQLAKKMGQFSKDQCCY